MGQRALEITEMRRFGILLLIIFVPMAQATIQRVPLQQTLVPMELLTIQRARLLLEPVPMELQTIQLALVRKPEPVVTGPRITQRAQPVVRGPAKPEPVPTVRPTTQPVQRPAAQGAKVPKK